MFRTTGNTRFVSGLMNATVNHYSSKASKMRVATVIVATCASIISFISTLSGNTVHAGPITYGQLYVYGSGASPNTDSDGNLIFEPEYNSRQTYFESDVALSKSDSLTSYVKTPDGVRSITAASSMVSRSGNLGVSSRTSGPSYSGAGSRIYWSDSIELVPPATGVEGPIDSLIFNFRIEGELVTQGSPTDPDVGFGSSQITAFLFDQVYYRNLQTIFENPGNKDQPIDDVVNSRLNLSHGYADFSYALDVLSQSEDGFASANFINTMTLKSITFADGSTPESLGYSLIFGSGMVSPNVSSVPEPSTLALAGLGGIGVAFSACRRRRLAA